MPSVVVPILFFSFVDNFLLTLYKYSEIILPKMNQLASIPSTIPPMENPDKWGIVGNGAGALSSYGTGVLSGIPRNMFAAQLTPPDVMIVSSGLAPGGAASVAGQADDAVRLWPEVGRSGVFSQNPDSVFPNINGEALMETVRANLKLENIWRSRTRLFFVVTNLKTGKPEYLEMTEEKGADYFDRALKATMGLPWTTGFQEIDGKQYGDGDLGGDIRLSAKYAREKLGIGNILAINSGTVTGIRRFLRKMVDASKTDPEIKRLLDIIRAKRTYISGSLAEDIIAVSPGPSDLECGVFERSGYDEIATTLCEGAKDIVLEERLGELSELLETLNESSQPVA